MKETLITFETSKLAKEKGFFDKNIYGEVRLSQYNFYDDNGVLRKIDEAFELTKDFDLKNCCNAPTQSLLQKWLREVYNIDVEPYLILMENNNRELEQDFDVKEYTYKLKDKGISQFVGNDGVKPSYDESFEIGLQEGLKLIPTE
jgi:hypothetical protein